MKKFLLNIWYTILYQFDKHRYEIPDWWYSDKPFDEIPIHLQRVRVAQDVIAQLSIARYKAVKGAYINRLCTHAESHEDVKDNFEKIHSCEVCGLGACLLSIVKYKNTLRFYDLYHASNEGNFSHNWYIKNLLSLFSPSQLFLIELAFEKSSRIMFMARSYDHFIDQHVSPQDKGSAFVFGWKYGEDKDRLIAIMQNIIDNAGTFKP